MRTKSRNSIEVLRDSITTDSPENAVILLFAQRVLFPEDFDKQTACEIYKKTNADRMFERIARCGERLSARDLELLFMYSVVAADRVEIEDGVIWLYSNKSEFEEEYESQDVPLPVVRRF